MSHIDLDSQEFPIGKSFVIKDFELEVNKRNKYVSKVFFENENSKFIMHHLKAWEIINCEIPKGHSIFFKIGGGNGKLLIKTPIEETLTLKTGSAFAFSNSEKFSIKTEGENLNFYSIITWRNKRNVSENRKKSNKQDEHEGEFEESMKIGPNPHFQHYSENYFYEKNFEGKVIGNDLFRCVLYTTNELQIVLQETSIREKILPEIHEDTIQFFKIEKGEGKININDKSHKFLKGSAFLIDKNTKHSFEYLHNSVISLYTIYIPPHHYYDEIKK